MVQPCTAPLRRMLSTSLTTALYKLGSSWNAPLCARISRLICDIVFHGRLIAIKKKAINRIAHSSYCTFLGAISDTVWVLCCLLGFGFCCDSFSIWYVSWYIRAYADLTFLFFVCSEAYDLFKRCTICFSYCVYYLLFYVFICFSYCGSLPLQSCWSLSCDHGLHCSNMSWCENNRCRFLYNVAKQRFNAKNTSFREFRGLKKMKPLRLQLSFTVGVM